MNERCSICHLAIAPSAILGQNIHVPISGREVMIAVRCASYGNPQPEEDIPSIWRSTGHWQAVWDRS